eukprot:gene16745-20109_t
MAKSTVGIAMGAAGSDVALETADIALMGDKLESLPFAIGLSRKAKGIIKQNLWISLGVVAVLIPLTILGVTSIGPAVMAHEVWKKEESLKTISFPKALWLAIVFRAYDGGQLGITDLF